MEAISLKLDERMLQNIDKNLKKHNYSTRTEFIRTAVRDKLAELSKEDLLEEFLKFRGRSGKKTTHAENRKTREQVSKELMLELEKRFS